MVREKGVCNFWGIFSETFIQGKRSLWISQPEPIKKIYLVPSRLVSFIRLTIFALVQILKKKTFATYHNTVTSLINTRYIFLLIVIILFLYYTLVSIQTYVYSIFLFTLFLCTFLPRLNEFFLFPMHQSKLDALYLRWKAKRNVLCCNLNGPSSVNVSQPRCYIDKRHAVYLAYFFV